MKTTTRRLIALGLVAVNGILLVMAGSFFWTIRNQELPSLPVPSVPSGIDALLRFISIFPWDMALFISLVFLLPAAALYPWRRRQKDVPVIPAESGVWPPPPNLPEQTPVKKRIRHWARPDDDADEEDLISG
jgi:hypothetical protein